MSWTTRQRVRLPMVTVLMSEARAYNTPGLYKMQADLPPLKGLSFLDRFLVLWILIAMGVGIAIGNTVDNAGPALQRGEFVGVSIPIGMYPRSCAHSLGR